jgi:hypothetical protein
MAKRAGIPTCSGTSLSGSEQITLLWSEANHPVTPIYHGFVSASMVKGRYLTSFRHDSVSEEIKKAGGSQVDTEVVIDINPVTSR